MSLGIGCDHRSVNGVLVFHVNRVAPFHRDSVVLGLQVNPFAAVFVLLWIIRIELLDVQILCIRQKYSKTPGDALIVAHRHAWQVRLHGPDDIPSRGIQVHQITQRRMIQLSMGIIGQQWSSGFRFSSGNHPVVAAFKTTQAGIQQSGLLLQFAESRSCADRLQLRFEMIVDDAQIHFGRYFHRNRRLGRE